MFLNVVLLRVQGEWWLFTEPLDLVVVRRPEEVPAALEHVAERVARGGLYAAGFVGFEAAAGFDAAFSTFPVDAAPALCLGLFHEVQRATAFDFSGAAATAHAWQLDVSRERYAAQLGAIKREIERGNTYQINYTLRCNAHDVTDPWALFLASAADAPYAAYLESERFAVVSASPELFFRLQGTQIECKPMKGTAARGLTLADDLARREWLRNSAKNRAENVMITDMIRNDLGRIAQTGTVRTAALFEVEKYATVWQMTSTVTAQTTASVPEIFRALFPSASVTGAPKRASLRIISAIEDTPRGVYTGAIGYLAPDGSAQFNVAIRTAWVDRYRQRASYGVGSGIVWESDPDEEYRECLAKTRVLTRGPVPCFELLETLRWSPAEGYFLLDAHLARLRDSAEYFGYAFDRQRMADVLGSLAGTLPATAHRVRVLLDRSGTLRTEASPLRDPARAEPWRLRLAAMPVDPQDPFLYHKTTHRAVYERVSQPVADCDDVLLWNEAREITETRIANVLVRVGGELVTPPVECGLLAGTYRGWLLERGEILERRVLLDELDAASEILLINSVRGRMPAVLLGAGRQS